MVTKYDPKPVGQFVFDQVKDVFTEETKEASQRAEKALKKAFATFFRDVASEIGGDQPGEIAEDWAPISEQWAIRKKIPPGGNRFYVGLKGLLQANLRRLNPARAYGNPKTVLKFDGKALTFGSGDPGKLTARIEFIAFPLVGKALGRLITPFSRRQQKILRFNEPMARKGHVHNRPLLFPMYEYYIEEELPRVFSEATT